TGLKRMTPSLNMQNFKNTKLSKSIEIIFQQPVTLFPASGAILAWHLAPVMVKNPPTLTASPLGRGASDEFLRRQTCKTRARYGLLP
ncbi:MAG: hypothetical protein FWC58_11710, partial [Desulfobulbus sp.]|nr:hypothetical protein [Desulfobulbus sp.]